MSASLVGSEMCIRDRCPARPLLGRGYRPPPDPPASACGARRRHLLGRVRGCLLYTSDAADDM
eukprot:5219204-Alexandrium_andersonii.AAC.1